MLLLWTAGIFAVWLLLGEALNSGVSDQDVQECIDEGFIPPSECEDTLQDLESDDPEPIALGVLFVVWAVGLLALGVATRPTSPASD